jgi:hypothetical protein
MVHPRLFAPRWFFRLQLAKDSSYGQSNPVLCQIDLSNIDVKRSSNLKGVPALHRIRVKQLKLDSADTSANALHRQIQLVLPPKLIPLRIRFTCMGLYQVLDAGIVAQFGLITDRQGVEARTPKPIHNPTTG